MNKGLSKRKTDLTEGRVLIGGLVVVYGTAFLAAISFLALQVWVVVSILQYMGVI